MSLLQSVVCTIVHVYISSLLALRIMGVLKRLRAKDKPSKCQSQVQYMYHIHVVTQGSYKFFCK